MATLASSNCAIGSGLVGLATGCTMSSLLTWLVAVVDRSSRVRGLCERVHRRSSRFATPRLFADVLTRAECEFVVAEAERHATDRGGWSTDRHENYPTTDVDTAQIPSVRPFVRRLVRERIAPRIEAAYGVPRGLVGINEVFVAKYADGAQRSLEQHTDHSEFSFVVTLNDGFEGGGTLFDRDKRVARPPAGSLLIFNGQERHEGLAVTSGTRYILAGFLHIGSEHACGVS